MFWIFVSFHQQSDILPIMKSVTVLFKLVPGLFTGQLAGHLLMVTVKQIQHHDLLELKAGIHGRFMMDVLSRI